MDLPIKWTNKYKQNWDEAWKRVEAWWRYEENDRPVVFNSVPKQESERRGQRALSAKTPEEAARFDIDLNVKLANAKYFLENTLFPAESAPYAYSDFAMLLHMLSAQAGGKILYTIDPYNAWIEKEDDIFDRDPPELRDPCRELSFALDLIKANHVTFGYDVILGANPMIDPMTALSLMRGSEEFLVNLVDREDDVMRWLKRLGEFHRQAISSYRETRATLGRREDYSWCGAWCPGDMDAIQCDVSTMISPKMFRKFVLPEMEYEASFYDFVIWHLDGSDEFKHIDDICSISNLNAVQYVDEKGQNPVVYSDLWKKILKQGKSLLFNCKSSFAVDLTRELRNKGLAFLCSDIKTEGDMDKLLKALLTI